MYGFDSMQDVNPIFWIIEKGGPILFLAVLAIMGIVIAKGIVQWSKNNRSPVLTVQARVVNLRIQVSGGTHTAGDDMMTHGASTSYYATLEVESGDRMEFSIGGEEYGLLSQGDAGSLTFQGTRYLGFRRH